MEKMEKEAELLSAGAAAVIMEENFLARALTRAEVEKISLHLAVIRQMEEEAAEQSAEGMTFAEAMEALARGEEV